MKRLTKIILVQWYLFEAEEIPVVGHTAIIGANGAGKSSIIDGVQTVLCGGNKTISLNKGSNEKSSRSIREYCLGVVSDPNSTVRVEPRPSANTYLALCFYDSEKDEHVSAGISIWATATDPNETVNGYFITRGEPLTIDDFTEDHDGGVATLPWTRFREKLIRRFTLGKYDKDFYDGKANLLLPHKGPGDFTRQFYTIMSADPAMSSNAKTLVKSLLAAIAFKPIADPTEFVRRNMLEPSPVNIRELKTSLDFWKNLQEKATQTAKNIERLEALEALCEKVVEAEADILLHEYTLLSARIEECYEIASPAEVQKDELDEEIKILDEEIEAQGVNLKQLEKELWEKEEDYNRQDTAQKIFGLKGKIDITKKELAQIETELNHKRSECLKLLKVVEGRAKLPSRLLSAVNHLLPMVQIDDDLLSADWLKFPAEVDAAVEAVRSEYEGQGKDEIQNSSSALWSKISPAVKECEERAKVIAQLENKEAPLQDKTRGLMALLSKNRIKSEPLCDLIDVKDEAWRNIIEAILGNIREALIVDPEQAREAIRLYRHEGKGYRGSHVVNTTKTEEWVNFCQKGSLAELVVTDNPHARAFINLRLGNIICVEKESELLAKDRAATKDMMFTSGGVTTMKYDPPLLMLGRAGREHQLARLRKLQEAQENEVDALKERQRAFSSAGSVLDRFVESFSGLGNFFSLNSAGQKEKEALEDKQKRHLALLESVDDSALKKVIDELREAFNALEKELGEKNINRQEKHDRRIQLGTTVEQHYKTAGVLEEARNDIAAGNPEFDSANGADLLDKLRTRFAESAQVYPDICAHINAHLENKRKVKDKNSNTITRDFAEFMSTYATTAYLSGGEELRVETFEETFVFIRNEKQRLEETTFANYAVQAENALRDVENIFRDKFISRLSERLEEVKENITHLNRILKDRRFTGEYYQFKAKPDPELKAIYDLAEDFANDKTAVGSVGGLFDPANDPNSPHRDAILKIKQAFQEEDLGALIQDYRNYFVFDVEMFNQNNQRVANLKHRLAKGSGGENMAPFYVAIGSSLASAYKIVNRPGKEAYGGMNLAPFDEAFSKLDGANIYNCIEFLKEINLQILLAAPDDKYTTLAGQIETIVWVTRHGGDIEIEIEYLTGKTHQMLLSDNPFAPKIETPVPEEAAV